MADLKLTYGNHTVDFATVPEQSVVAMLRRGFAHFLGSEQASKVTAYFDPDRKLAEGEERLADTPENRDKIKADYQAKALDALLAGTVGMSTRGPTIDPITTIINRLARQEVHNILKASGVKPPKKADDTVEIGVTKYTTDQLIARRLDPASPAGVDKKTGVAHLERLTKEANKIAAEQAKKNAKALEAAKAEGAEAL
jgi:hypothetical protein